MSSLDLLQTGQVAHRRRRATGALRRSLRPLSRSLQAVRAVPHLATYVGLVVALAGGVLLVVAWGRVAGLTSVALQMPYVVSAGFTGLALVAVGLTVVNVAAKHEDAARRRAQAAELHALVAELRRVLEEPEP